METHLAEAPFLFFSSRDDGTIIAINNFLLHQLHFQPEELSGKKTETFFTLSTRIFQQTHLFPLLNIQGQVNEIYITLKTKEGDQLPVLMNAERKVVNGEALTLYAGITVYNRKKFEDELVAARKAAETALNENTALLQAKHELQQQAELLDRQMSLAEKQNEELRQFSRVVTHDLQEPLRKLFVFTNMLLESKIEETVGKTVHKIRSVSERMRSLVSGLQQYIWLIETPVATTTIRLENMLPVIKEQVQKEYTVIIDMQMDSLPTLHGDAEQMIFLFREIFSNAARFRKGDEPVVIRIEATLLQHNRFRTVTGKYDYALFVKLQIHDNGSGFDPAYKAQVFELFKRLHPASGAGIGLSLCKKIVDNHQGFITIDSKPGEGTTVNILLPHPGKEEPTTESGPAYQTQQRTEHGS